MVTNTPTVARALETEGVIMAKANKANEIKNLGKVNFVGVVIIPGYLIAPWGKGIAKHGILSARRIQLLKYQCVAGTCGSGEGNPEEALLV